jgi:glutaredoxin 3
VKAREAFGNDAVYVDVKQDAAKLEEMLRHSKGRRDVPVIVEGEKVTIGYGGS